MPYMEKAEEIKEVSPIVLTSENQKDRLKGNHGSFGAGNIRSF